jgi:hypothetical protein
MLTGPLNGCVVKSVFLFMGPGGAHTTKRIKAGILDSLM